MDEVAQFLTETMQLSLVPETLALLGQRTEGWVAGLQLAALALRGRTDPATFVQQLRGSDRSIASYLLEEVLLLQPVAVRHFLLCTSVVPHFTADLAHALLVDLPAPHLPWRPPGRRPRHAG